MKPLATVLAVAALAAAVTLDASASDRVGLHWGDIRSLGAGKARAWVAVDVDGSASSMGVSIDEAAMKVKKGQAPIEAVLPLPNDVTLAGVAASGTSAPAFRVRYDVERRAYLVILEGIAPVAAAPAGLATQAGTR